MSPMIVLAQNAPSAPDIFGGAVGLVCVLWVLGIAATLFWLWMLIDDLPADTQAQAAAAVAVFVRLLGAVERLEDQPQLLRRDSDAAVADFDLGHLRRLILAHLDHQPAAARHRLAGVDD